MAAQRRRAAPALPAAAAAAAAREVVGVEDMVLLVSDTKESGIVQNLSARLAARSIYTYIGDVLITLNPFAWLQIYDEATMKQYEHKARQDVAPHIFATAEAAFRSLILEEESQCVIISGESGAGKTEASKQIQSYIAVVSGGGKETEHIKRVFLESNPVLEAFGNAKTLRNNNSSRFGKYFELKFDRFGTPAGGYITNYLLEKSRIVKPGGGERNFHVFYQLLESKHAKEFQLGAANEFTYLSCSKCWAIDGVNEGVEFDLTWQAMRSVGMDAKTCKAVLSLVAAVLHVGNVRFTAHAEGSADGSKVAKDELLALACRHLQVDPAALSHALRHRELQTMAPGGKVDTYQVPQNPSQAAARRDGVAKAVYERLFNTIVYQINRALDPSLPETAGPDLVAASASRQAADADNEVLSIGILDIYGFEVFDVNSFEQLCINYVNEKLQQIFIELTLFAEQEEYDREGIKWTPIPFFNNKVVCDLLDGAKPSGLFRILDDTCKTLHGATSALDVDRKFLESASQVFGKHAHFTHNNTTFMIKHYAGGVAYSVGSFGESNKDALSRDLLAVLKASAHPLLPQLFPEELEEPTGGGRGRGAAGGVSAGTRIRVQCNALVTALKECTPHYVRCIKSNDQKQPLTVDPQRVQHQVKYLGLVENIKVRRAGFAYRADFFRFLRRFNVLCTETFPDWAGEDREGCRRIVKALAGATATSVAESTAASVDTKHAAAAVRTLLAGDKEVQYGRTKIFIRKPETVAALEKLREMRMGDFAACVQRAWRRHHMRRELLSMQVDMAALYAKSRKARRRDSMFRPYAGDYLAALGAALEGRVREGVYRVIDHHVHAARGVPEDVVFADAACAQVVKGTGAGAGAVGSIEARLVVLTTHAVYVLQLLDAANPAHAQQKRPDQLPPVLLRRRVPLAAPGGGASAAGHGRPLRSVHLSLQADNCVVLQVAAAGAAAAHTDGVDATHEPDTSHWAPDQTKCALTGLEFGMFLWRHHCRVCGRAVSDGVSDYYAPCPDRHYTSPQRVCDTCIGVQSVDPSEDLLLLCDRKTELVALLREQWRRLAGGTLPLAFGNAVPLAAVADKRALPLSTAPAAHLLFTAQPPSHGRACGAAASPFLACEHPKLSAGVSGALELSSPPGLPQEVVEQRRARDAERRRVAEAKRRALDEQRRVRSQQRDAQREHERLQRLAEKRARKANEKEARQAALEGRAPRPVPVVPVVAPAALPGPGPRGGGVRATPAPTPAAAPATATAPAPAPLASKAPAIGGGGGGGGGGFNSVLAAIQARGGVATPAPADAVSTPAAAEAVHGDSETDSPERRKEKKKKRKEEEAAAWAAYEAQYREWYQTTGRFEGAPPDPPRS